MNADREAILSRVRQALKRPSPDPHWEHEPVATGPLFDLPDHGGLLARFQSEFTAVMGTWIEGSGVDDAKARLAAFLQAEAVREFVALDDPLVRSVVPETTSPRWVPRNPMEQPPAAAGWANLDASISTAECLVAESGTIVVTGADSGRALTVLPPLHIVIARESQVLTGLPEAMRHLREKYGEQLPSMCCFITGPSRTADIEKILVLGAHGPKKLACVLIRGC